MSARGAQSERELDRKGPVRARRPDTDRQIKSVAAAPHSFSDGFTFDRIVHALAKWRVRAMARRHDAEFYASHFKGEKDPAELVPCAGAAFLPPRNRWSRPQRRERFRSADELAVASILRTVRGFQNRGTLEQTDWGRRLVELVRVVQARAEVGVFVLNPPRLMFRRKDANAFRLLAGYDDLADKLLLKGTADYLRAMFDPLMSERCYSFRASPDQNNRTAVVELVNYRLKHRNEKLYAAECDIMKFFDILDHREVLKVYDEFAAKTLQGVDPRARAMVVAYLQSYDFNAYPKRIAATDSKTAELLAKVATIPVNVVERLYGDVPEAERRYGLPQGGALSPLIANMVLTAADERMAQFDSELFYIRFCDDMVLVHPDPARCAAAQEVYFKEVAKRRLPVHDSRPEGFVYGAEYFSVKTKNPFLWEDVAVGTRNASPWMSFLGNHIRFDGSVRIRRETVARHLANLKGERQKFLQRITPVLENGLTELKGKQNPRRVEAMCKRYCARLVAKGVGFMKAGEIADNAVGWLAAFPAVVENRSDACARQMRALDAIRDRLLKPFDAVLTGKDGTRRFFGRPFGYYGFWKKVSRPAQPIPGRGKGTGAAPCFANDFHFYRNI